MRVHRLAPLGALTAALAAVALSPALAGDTDSTKKLFWKVTSDKGGEVYLLGSVHVGTDDMYPLPKEIEDAFKKSDALAVEADVEKVDPAKIQALVLSKGRYEGEDNLETKLSKESWKKLEAYCEKESVPLDQLKPMKPWLVALQLQGLAFQKLGV